MYEINKSILIQILNIVEEFHYVRIMDVTNLTYINTKHKKLALKFIRQSESEKFQYKIQ